MSLYSAAEEPTSHAVRVVLAEKAVNVEIHFVSDSDPPEDLHTLNPYDSILTLVDRDLVLYEAADHHGVPRRAVPPSTPDAGGPGHPRDQPAVPLPDTADIYGLVDSIEGDAPDDADHARRQLRDHLTTLAPIFDRSRFFMADEYSLVDCYLAPILWRLPRYGIKLPPRSRGLRATWIGCSNARLRAEPDRARRRNALTSNRPYLIRAIYEWIVDNGLTPYLLVSVEGEDVVVPGDYVKDGRIVLSISPRSVRSLDLGNEASCSAARGSVAAISRSMSPCAACSRSMPGENGKGIALAEEEEGEGPPPDSPPKKGPPKLRVVS